MSIKDIKLVEIELFNYCNRTCSFCPNNSKPRNKITDLKLMRMDVFESIINNLYENSFNGVITFSRYNEPFAIPSVLAEAVRYIRLAMPHVKVVTNTNGDYLSSEVINLFDEVTIMDYDGKGEEIVDEIEKLYPEAEIRRKGNIVTFYREAPNNNFRANDPLSIQSYTELEERQYFLTSEMIPFISVFKQFRKHSTIEDRGGTVEDKSMKMKNEHKRRVRNCNEPKYFLGIDYTGDVMPCCNMRHDTHKEFIMGNVKDKSLKEIVDGGEREMIIRLTSDGERMNLHPCTYCQKDPGRYTRPNPGLEYKGERE